MVNDCPDTEGRMLSCLSGYVGPRVRESHPSYAHSGKRAFELGCGRHSSQRKDCQRILRRLQRRGEVTTVGHGGGKNTRYALTAEVERVRKSRVYAKDQEQREQAERVARRLNSMGNRVHAKDMLEVLQHEGLLS